MNEEQMKVVAELYAKNDSLEIENKELHNKINKAVDLIEKSVTSDVGFNSKGQIVKYHQLTEDETGELLEILKDSDVDE